MGKRIYIHFFLLLLLLAACRHRQPEQTLTPWGGETADSLSADFDLEQIVGNGEMIVLTQTGPETYYDYHGRHLGTQYLLCQRFADKIGVGLRVEVCRDSAEAVRRLKAGDGDIALLASSDSLLSWQIGPDKPQLKREILSWYRPQYLGEVRKEEQYLLSSRSVKRHVYAPMLNAKGGVISRYDAQFQKHARRIRWDWRLLAAQCYQESTFDPQARSWAGACGLMQIMPSTADHLGLAHSDLFDVEKNIAAAVKYLEELDGHFADIPNRTERTKFMLAAYNGGFHHIRDAMALTQKHGKDSRRWNDVSQYVLALAQPQYYTDPVVKNGYMRGTETEDYVRKIMARWNGYRGVRATRTNVMGVPQKAHHEKKKYKIE